jgi:hypothetical protein
MLDFGLVWGYNENMNTFITNSGEKSLRKRLVDLISKSEELKFLEYEYKI